MKFGMLIEELGFDSQYFVLLIIMSMLNCFLVWSLIISALKKTEQWEETCLVCLNILSLTTIVFYLSIIGTRYKNSSCFIDSHERYFNCKICVIGLGVDGYLVHEEQRRI